MQQLTFRTTDAQKRQLDSLVDDGEFASRSEAVRNAVKEMLDDV